MGQGEDTSGTGQRRSSGAITPSGVFDIRRISAQRTFVPPHTQPIVLFGLHTIPPSSYLYPHPLHVWRRASQFDLPALPLLPLSASLWGGGENIASQEPHGGAWMEAPPPSRLRPSRYPRPLLYKIPPNFPCTSMIYLRGLARCIPCRTPEPRPVPALQYTGAGGARPANDTSGSPIGTNEGEEGRVSHGIVERLAFANFDLDPTGQAHSTSTQEFPPP